MLVPPVDRDAVAAGIRPGVRRRTTRAACAPDQILALMPHVALVWCPARSSLVPGDHASPGEVGSLQSVGCCGELSPVGEDEHVAPVAEQRTAQAEPLHRPPRERPLVFGISRKCRSAAGVAVLGVLVDGIHTSFARSRSPGGIRRVSDHGIDRSRGHGSEQRQGLALVQRGGLILEVGLHARDLLRGSERVKHNFTSSLLVAVWQHGSARRQRASASACVLQVTWLRSGSSHSFRNGWAGLCNQVGSIGRPTVGAVGRPLFTNFRYSVISSFGGSAGGMLRASAAD